MRGPATASRLLPLVVALGAVAGCASDEPAPRPARRSPTLENVEARPRLLVDSVPSDAVVRVDGVLAGTTPCAIEEIAAGPHEVLVSGPSGSRSERVVVRRDEPAAVVVTTWTKPRTPRVAHDPGELAQWIVEAIREDDRSSLELLVLARGEVTTALGEAQVDRVRLRLIDQVNRDLNSLQHNAGISRARRLRVTDLEPRRMKLTRDAFAREVEVVPAPVLHAELAGRSLTIPLGALVRAGEGWKILTLLPSRHWQ